MLIRSRELVRSPEYPHEDALEPQLPDPGSDVDN